MPACMQPGLLLLFFNRVLLLAYVKTLDSGFRQIAVR